MHVALVRRRYYIRGEGSSYGMTAHLIHGVDEASKVALCKELGQLLIERPVKEIEVVSVVELDESVWPSTLIMSVRSSYKGHFEEWLTEIASSAFAKGEVVGHNEAVMER